jgi:hypothetical protein
VGLALGLELLSEDLDELVTMNLVFVSVAINGLPGIPPGVQVHVPPAILPHVRA